MKSLIPWKRADHKKVCDYKIFQCLLKQATDNSDAVLLEYNIIAFHATDSVSSAHLFSLTLSWPGFSSISLSWSWSVVLSSWLIRSVARVSASSSWLSFSSFCFCSLSFMHSSSLSRNSLRRPNSADTISSRSPVRSWNTGKTLVSRTKDSMKSFPAFSVPLLCITLFILGKY